MRKCSLYIAEPPGMDVGGIMGFFGVLLPENLPVGFEFDLKPWHNQNENQDITFCVRVTKVEFTILGDVNYVSEEGAHTVVFVEPVMDKTKATQEEWQKFSETAST